VLRQTDLQLDSILYDEGILSEMRTAAASALASSVLMDRAALANSTGSGFLVGLVGCGIQGVWQLRFLQKALKCINPSVKLRAIVKSRSLETAKKFQTQMGTSPYKPDNEWDILILGEQDTSETFTDCALIHTLTTARSPVLTLADVGGQSRLSDKSKPRLHITAVGADSPGKRELSGELLAAADLKVCDSRPQSKTRGEFQHCESMLKRSAEGETKFDGEVLELGEILEQVAGDAASADLAKFNAKVLSVFDTSGIAVQDVAIAKAVCQAMKVN
jgi:ornithine cyclodeaminase